MRAGVALALVCLACAARAQLDPEETATLLATWLDAPLELSTATASELAQLPWLSMEDATRVIGLREEGGLRSFDDLSRAGLDPTRLEAIRPFVQLAAERGGWLRARRRADDTRRPRDDLHARGRFGTWSGHVVVDAADAPTGSLRWRERIWVGDFLPLAGWGLALDDPRARSSTAPVRWSPTLRLVRPSAGVPAWRGVALRVGRGRVESVLGWDTTERRAVVAGRWTAAVWEAGFGVRHHLASSRVAVWWRLQRRRGRAGIEWRPRSRGRSAAVAAVRWVEGARRVGLSFALAPAAGDGRDPITGQGLDRPHRVWQVWARGRLDGAAWGVLLRGRDRAGEATSRAELRCEAPTPPGRLELRLRGDQEGQAVDRITGSVALVTGSGPRRFRVWLRQELRASGRRDLAGVTVRETRARVLLHASAAFAGGAGASYWAFGSPHGGVSGHWLDPAATGLAAGVGWSMGSGGRVSLAGAWEGGAGLRPSLAFSLQWSRGRPQLVQRLH